MNFNLIFNEKNNNIFNIILNDQKNQNTLSENMINELTSALDIADKDNEVKVIILSSKGNIFCAGHNLKDLNSQRLQNDKGESYFKKIFQMCSQLMLKINKNNKFIKVKWFEEIIKSNRTVDLIKYLKIYRKS